MHFLSHGTLRYAVKEYQTISCVKELDESVNRWLRVPQFEEIRFDPFHVWNRDIQFILL